MQFDTFLFGKIDVNPDTIITFPEGLPGFSACKRYTLVHEQNGAQEPTTYTLQSLDDPTVALQIVDPTMFGFHYELELTTAEAAQLKAESPSDVAVMLVLFRRDQKDGAIEANVRAPILINTKARLGLQKVIERVRPNVTLSNLSSPV